MIPRNLFSSQTHARLIFIDKKEKIRVVSFPRDPTLLMKNSIKVMMIAVDRAHFSLDLFMTIIDERFPHRFLDMIYAIKESALV